MIGIVMMAFLLAVLQYLGLGDVVAVAANLGLLFLALTLLPINIMKLRFGFLAGALPALGWLVRHRRDFGILCGLLFVIHGTSAYIEYSSVSPSFLFTKPILPGVIAAFVIILMLLTSNLWVQQRLSRWRNLHELIWFILPLGMAHATGAALEYIGDDAGSATAAFGTLMVFVLVEFVLAKVRRLPLNWWHILMTLLGVGAAMMTQVL